MNENVKGYIICESSFEPTKPTIVGTDKGVDRVTINTTLQSVDTKNRNKRIYPKQVIQNGLNSPYIQERLRTKSWYGEAGNKIACL